MQDPKGLEYYFEKFKTDSSYNKIFEDFNKAADTALFKAGVSRILNEITYKAYDNGRGEIWIEVLD